MVIRALSLVAALALACLTTPFVAGGQPRTIGYVSNLDAAGGAKNANAFYEGAFRAARSGGAQAMLVLPSPALNADRRQLIDLAARYQLPAAFEFRVYVEDGGLLPLGITIPQSLVVRADRVIE
jgi:hypothetical protein